MGCKSSPSRSQFRIVRGVTLKYLATASGSRRSCMFFSEVGGPRSAATTFIRTALIRARRGGRCGPLVDHKTPFRASGRFRSFPLVSAQFLDYSACRLPDPSNGECGYSLKIRVSVVRFRPWTPVTCGISSVFPLSRGFSSVAAANLDLIGTTPAARRKANRSSPIRPRI